MLFPIPLSIYSGKHGRSRGQTIDRWGPEKRIARTLWPNGSGVDTPVRSRPLGDERCDQRLRVRIPPGSFSLFSPGPTHGRSRKMASWSAQRPLGVHVPGSSPPSGLPRCDSWLGAQQPQRALPMLGGERPWPGQRAWA